MPLGRTGLSAGGRQQAPAQGLHAHRPPGRAILIGTCSLPHQNDHLQSHQKRTVAWMSGNLDCTAARRILFSLITIRFMTSWGQLVEGELDGILRAD